MPFFVKLISSFQVMTSHIKSRSLSKFFNEHLKKKLFFEKTKKISWDQVPSRILSFFVKLISSFQVMTSHIKSRFLSKFFNEHLKKTFSLKNLKKLLISSSVKNIVLLCQTHLLLPGHDVTYQIFRIRIRIWVFSQQYVKTAPFFVKLISSFQVMTSHHQIFSGSVCGSFKLSIEKKSFLWKN